jgi:hypothetical protein
VLDALDFSLAGVLLGRPSLRLRLLQRAHPLVWFHRESVCMCVYVRVHNMHTYWRGMTYWCQTWISSWFISAPSVRFFRLNGSQLSSNTMSSSIRVSPQPLITNDENTRNRIRPDNLLDVDKFVRALRMPCQLIRQRWFGIHHNSIHDGCVYMFVIGCVVSVRTHAP